MFYLATSVISLVIVSVLLISVFIKKDENNKFRYALYKKLRNYINKHYYLVICLLLGITIFTSFFKLGEVPYGMHVDEAGMAYDAMSISKYGVDRYLNSNPIYLINYGGGQSAMYAYLASILIKIFGYSQFIIRLPIAIFRILTFISIIFILGKDGNKLRKLIFLFLFSITPYFIMQSRWGLDCNLLMSFISISLAFLICSIEQKKQRLILLLCSGISFGLSLYTYALSYIILPIFLFFLCIYILYTKKLKIRHLIILGLPIFILAIPLMLMILINNGIINEFHGFITIPLLKNYRGSEISLNNIPHNLYIILSLFSFDKEKILIYNSIPYFGTIYYMSIPFFIIGFANCFKKLIKSFQQRKLNVNIIFMLLFLSVLICQLLIANPNINKANPIFIPILYFTAIGIEIIFRKYKQLVLPILLLFLLNFGIFFNYYYYHYDNDNNNQYFFATCYLDAVEYARNLEQSHIFIDNDLTAQQYIYILLNNAISPYNYAENNIKTIYNNKEIIYTFGIPNEVNKDYIYIVGDKEELINKFNNMEFDYVQYGNLKVFFSK